MDRSNSFDSIQDHRLNRRSAVALLASMGVSGAAVAQDKPKEAEPAANDPNDDIAFERFGDPLAIDLGDGMERTLYLMVDKLPQNKNGPAHQFFYHDLALALVPRKERLPGFPAWVQKVVNRENDTQIDIRFRLSSPKLRAAAEAILRSDKRASSEKNKHELQVPVHRIKAEPVPAYELRVFIQDTESGLTLASAGTDKLRSYLNKDVILSFRFKRESLAMFLRCEKEGTLQFTPYYKARAKHYIMARKQTTVNCAVGLKVKQLLDHRQRTKLKKEDKNTILPILQDHINKIARDIWADIHSDIVATDPALITFLHSDTMVVTSCFVPCDPMDFTKFRDTFPDFTDQMLAEYLKPYGVTRTKIKEKQNTDGKQHTDEKTNKSGGGIGFSLDLDRLAVGASGQKESAQRVLDTIWNVAGIRLVDGGSENFYKPTEVKINKLAEGYEEKKLAQASSVTLTKGPVQSYMDLSPFGPDYDVATLEKSLEKTLNENNHVARLLAKKAELESALDDELTKLEKARSKHQSLVASIDTERKKLHDAHVSAQSTKYNAGREHGIIEYVLHGRAQKWAIPSDKNFFDEHSKENSRFEERATTFNAGVVKANSAIDKTVTAVGEQNNTIVACQEKIAQLRGEIHEATEEVLSILKR